MSALTKRAASLSSSSSLGLPLPLLLTVAFAVNISRRRRTKVFSGRLGHTHRSAARTAAKNSTEPEGSQLATAVG
ncbi:hypothetical protein U9M48_007630 [Paspalum notatum var. saurae]|uniref:Uncharacterized protein n=1 Tax=Paspalum notatum var. saurae TaxID=547442 RepID=A0AAQ3WC41_PASNO